MRDYEVRCIRCGARYATNEVIYTCRACGGLLDITYDYATVDAEELVCAGGAGVWKYRVLLPFGEEIQPITIQEGNTPLYQCDRLAELVGRSEERRVGKECSC